MEVATPCISSTPRLSALFPLSSSPPRMPSQSILPPMYESSPSAIHGISCSNHENACAMVWTHTQPSMGISA